MDPLLERLEHFSHETPQERELRVEQNFPQVEASLNAATVSSTSPVSSTSTVPSQSPTSSLTLSGSSLKTSTVDTTSPTYLVRLKNLRFYFPPITSQLFDNVTSYLGKSNPCALSARSPKDSVWLLDNLAYRPVSASDPLFVAQHAWHAEFTSCYFLRDSGRNLSRVVADIAEKVGLRDMNIPNDEGEKRIAERLRPFLEVLRPARHVDVRFGGKGGKTKRLGPAGRSAVISQVVGPLGRFTSGDVVETHALVPELCPLGPMRTYFAGPEGWAVVSGKY